MIVMVMVGATLMLAVVGMVLVEEDGRLVWSLCDPTMQPSMLTSLV